MFNTTLPNRLRMHHAVASGSASKAMLFRFARSSTIVGSVVDLAATRTTLTLTLTELAFIDLNAYGSPISVQVMRRIFVCVNALGLPTQVQWSC